MELLNLRLSKKIIIYHKKAKTLNFTKIIFSNNQLFVGFGYLVAYFYFPYFSDKLRII